MLKHLRIQNIILIESADITFEAGLNVLSGETGSGKSALMNALNLIVGERTDTSVIRRGAEKGVVEAVFDTSAIPQLEIVLEQGGIDHEKGEDLIIRREISLAGKSRAFINNQMAQLGLLRKAVPLLLDIVGQHANQQLLSVDNHRDILDIFGGLEQDAAAFAHSWEEERQQRMQLDEMVRSEAQRLRDIEMYERELEELRAAQLQENEEEELFAEYSLLTNSENLLHKVQEITQTLCGDRQNALAILTRHKAAFEHIGRIDPSLVDSAKAYENALLELQEVAYTLTRYQSSIEQNPDRVAEVNERLSLINRLKKRYGNTIAEIREYQVQSEQKLHLLCNGDCLMEELRQQLQKLEERNSQVCQKLTEQRRKAAHQLETAVTQELRALNMPNVEFFADMAPQKRNSSGEDHVEFYLSPNVGEHRIPVKECASGGELSRLMLALQSLLAGKKQVPSLIFDEIDANIGGETAVVVGANLRKIGSKHQVLCITHFPQVAKQAHHHLQISKHEHNGRTLTLIKELDEDAREEELTRMLGGT